MGATEVEAFRMFLARDQDLSASPRSKAPGALVFLYQKLLDKDLSWLKDIVRAKRPKPEPVVFSQIEVAPVLDGLAGWRRLADSLPYGSGLRLFECLRLRVRAIDRDCLQLTVHDAKGRKDRRTLLPEQRLPHIER